MYPRVVNDGYRLHPDVTTDWHQWQQLLPDGPAAAPTTALAAALDLIKGRPFAGTNPCRYAWADRDRQDIISAIVDVAHELARRALLDANAPLARRAAAAGLQADPGAELLWRDALKAEWLAGDRTGLESTADRLTALIDELGDDLEPDTIALLEELLHHPAAGSPPDDTSWSHPQIERSRRSALDGDLDNDRNRPPGARHVDQPAAGPRWAVSWSATWRTRGRHPRERGHRARSRRAGLPLLRPPTYNWRAGLIAEGERESHRAEQRRAAGGMSLLVKRSSGTASSCGCRTGSRKEASITPRSTQASRCRRSTGSSCSKRDASPLTTSWATRLWRR